MQICWQKPFSVAHWEQLLAREAALFDKIVSYLIDMFDCWDIIIMFQNIVGYLIELFDRSAKTSFIYLIGLLMTNFNLFMQLVTSLICLQVVSSSPISIPTGHPQ